MAGVGDRFGRLVVTAVHQARGPQMVDVRCDCGTQKTVRLADAKARRARSCGCLRREAAFRVGTRERIGKVFEAGVAFGLWTVVCGGNFLSKQRVECRCRCGKVRRVIAESLTAGKSHGCQSCSHPAELPSRRKTFRRQDMPEHRAWSSMHHRCNPAFALRFPDYAGRGISVCVEWGGSSGFARFLDHVGARPSPNHSIDRINNDGNYEPGNVRWATTLEQANNRRSTVTLSLDGETMSVADWSGRVGIPASTLRQRILRGWSDADALTVPVDEVKRARSLARSDTRAA